MCDFDIFFTNLKEDMLGNQNSPKPKICPKTIFMVVSCLNSFHPSKAPAPADFLGFTCFFLTCLTPSNLAWFWQIRGSIGLAHFQLSNGGIGVWIRSNLDFWWFYKPRLSDLPFAGISQPAKMLQLMDWSRSNKPRLSIRMDTLTFWAELVHVVPWPAAVYPCAKTCVIHA